jgi:hypothetical protein
VEYKRKKYSKRNGGESFRRINIFVFLLNFRYATGTLISIALVYVILRIECKVLIGGPLYVLKAIKNFIETVNYSS